MLTDRELEDLGKKTERRKRRVERGRQTGMKRKRRRSTAGDELEKSKKRRGRRRRGREMSGFEDQNRQKKKEEAAEEERISPQRALNSGIEAPGEESVES